MFQPEHTPTGIVCTKCGIHASRHRVRPSRTGSRANHVDRRPNTPTDRVIGIDGEGIGRNPHRYVYLAAADGRGHVWDTAASRGLSSTQCFDLLLSLPVRSLVVGFSLSYDRTKWLADLPDVAIHALLHEETRQRLLPNGRLIYKPIIWNGYKLNYMNGRMTIATIDNKRRVAIWDIWRFFQSSFVKALEAWKVCPQSEIDEIQAMKEVRSELEKKTLKEVQAYCQQECRNLVKLTEALIQAHKDAGLPLKSFFGAGSTAAVFLNNHGIGDKRGSFPEEMRLPLACSFFGGRFENSFTGAVKGRVWSYDISSAYPYQTTRLPCLLCGNWVYRGRCSSAHWLRGRLSLVHWRSSPLAGPAWGALPIRVSDGTIVFPIGAKGGWTWAEEFRAACKLNPTLEIVETWEYQNDCEHHPFDSVPRYYRERVSLGKDAKGIVLKLGINSIYGKLAQSKGVDPPFQSWIWAGNITSNTRAQLLGAISAARRDSDILMLATDGVYSRSKLSLGGPVDLGTGDLEKPLGGWEEKVLDDGVFCVRPGIYFPLNPTVEQINQVRGRGLGRKSLFDNWQTIVEAWNEGKTSIEIGGMTRFVGARSGLTKSAKGITRREVYGEWVPHSVNVSFSPEPKRQAINPDGTLRPWGYLDFKSVPYDPATLSNDAIMLKLAELIMEEQPDGDFSDVT